MQLLPDSNRRLLSVAELRFNLLDCTGVFTVPAPTTQYMAVYVKRDIELKPSTDCNTCVTCKNPIPVDSSIGIFFCSFGCKYLPDAFARDLETSSSGGVEVKTNANASVIGNANPICRSGGDTGAGPQACASTADNSNLLSCASPTQVVSPATPGRIAGAESLLSMAVVNPGTLPPSAVLGGIMYGPVTNGLPMRPSDANAVGALKDRVGATAGVNVGGILPQGTASVHGGSGLTQSAVCGPPSQSERVPGFYSAPTGQLSSHANWVSPGGVGYGMQQLSAADWAKASSGFGHVDEPVVEAGAVLRGDEGVTGEGSTGRGFEEQRQNGFGVAARSIPNFLPTALAVQNSQVVRGNILYSSGDGDSFRRSVDACPRTNGSGAYGGQRGRGRGGRGQSGRSKSFGRGRGKPATSRKRNVASTMLARIEDIPAALPAIDLHAVESSRIQKDASIQAGASELAGFSPSPEGDESVLDAAVVQLEKRRDVSTCGGSQPTICAAVGGNDADIAVVTGGKDRRKATLIPTAAGEAAGAEHFESNAIELSREGSAKAIVNGPLTGKLSEKEEGSPIVAGVSMLAPSVSKALQPKLLPKVEKPRCVRPRPPKTCSACEVCGRAGVVGEYISVRFCSKVCRYKSSSMKQKKKSEHRRLHESGEGGLAARDKHAEKRRPVDFTEGRTTPEGKGILSLAGRPASKQGLDEPRPGHKAARASISQAAPETEDPDAAMKSRMLVACGMCRSRTLWKYALSHPLLSLQSFRLCRKCGTCVYKRLRSLTAANTLGNATSAAVSIASVDHSGFQDENDEDGDGVVSVVVRDADGHTVEGSRTAAGENPDAPDMSLSRSGKQALRLIASVEEFLFMSSPDDLAQGGIKDLRLGQDVSSRQRATELKQLEIPLEMLGIIRAIFVRIGVSFLDGKLSWPLDAIFLPSVIETVWMVETAVPRTLSDREGGTTAGVRAWNEAFPGNVWLRESVEPRSVFGLVLGLFGVALAPPRRSSGRRSEGVIVLDPLSISTAMHNAYDRCTDERLKKLLDSPQLVVPRALTRARQFELETKLLQDPAVSDSCCSCCGSVQNAVNFPFRLFACTSCPKQVCSLCLLNVFGMQGYVVTIRTGLFECQLCKMSKKLLAITENCGSGPTGAANVSRIRRRLPTSGVSGKVRGGVRKPLIPLLVVAPSVYIACVRLKDDENRAKYQRLAAFCENLNDEYLAITPGARALPETASKCLVCKDLISTSSATSDATAIENEGSASDGLFCTVSGCATSVHASCTSVAKTVEPGENAPWCCGLHVCAVCETPCDDSTPESSGAGLSSPLNPETVSACDVQLVRCRLCPRAYCEKHLPPWKDIHVYDENLIVCPDCAPLIEPPRLTPGQIEAFEKDSARHNAALPAMKAFFAAEKKRRRSNVKRLCTDLQQFMESGAAGPIPFAKRVRVANRGRRK